MTLFDGAGTLLTGVFGALYPDALLHRKTRGADTEGGSAAVTFGDGDLAKVQQTRVTRRMMEAEGYAEKDVGFIILTRYEASELPAPMPGDRMTWPKESGSLYSLEVPIDLDDAASHWTARGRPVR